MNTFVTFVRIPKNASTSVYEALGTANTIRDEKLFKFSQREKARYKGCFCPSHCLLSEAVRELGEEILNVPSLAVVRNPYDRLVSMYSFAQKNEWMFAAYLVADYSFGSFCRTLFEAKNNGDFLHAFAQKDYLTMRDDKVINAVLLRDDYIFNKSQLTIGVDRVLKFENINEEFKKFIADYEIVNVDPALTHENQTPHAPYKDFYCAETKSMVYKMWEEDLDEFKYTF